MKITILSFGSAGDVVPYISLAQGLTDRNHEVILAAPQNFEQFIKSYHIHYMPLHGDTQALLESERGLRWMAAGDTKSFFKELSEVFYSIRHELQRDAMAACQDAQMIIIGTLMINYGTTLSEKLKIPFLVATVNPVSVSTKAFPHFVVSYKGLPFGFLNALTYKLAFNSYSKLSRDQINEWRISLGLKPTKTNVYDQIKKLSVPVLHGYSPNLLPKPGDWGHHISVTGVWKISPGKKPSEEPSEDFMQWIRASRIPIVYFGFGSMPVLNPSEIQKMVFEICEETGLRAVINAGWSKFQGKHNAVGDQVYLIKHANLEWLFPQCSIIVHHGGVGTTHLSLESGVPTIICSIVADNPLWGERLERLNIGKHIRFKELDKNKIIKAIKHLQNDKIRISAIQIGDKVRAENGVKTAVDIIEYHLPRAPIYNSEF
jgi:sterol 3beta-glucosyltransferase